MKFELCRQTSEKYLNIKLHEDLFSGSRVAPLGRVGRRTDMTKLIVDFRNLANAPKNKSVNAVQENNRCLV